MNTTTAEIDLAKNIFSVHGIDGHGRVALKKTVSRSRLLELFANLPPTPLPVTAENGGIALQRARCRAWSCFL